MNIRGFTHVVLLLSLALVLLTSSFIIRNSNIKTNPTSSPTVTHTPNASGLDLVTQTSNPTPTPKPTTLPSPKITPKAVTGPPGNGLSSISIATEKGTFSVTVLSMDLGSTKVITDTANDSDCANGCLVSSLQSFVEKNGGFAGVNGTYFCPIAYTECSEKTNSFDFPVYNTRLGHWINGGNIFWNNRSMIYFDGSGAHYLQNANSFNGSLTAGIVNHPGLVNEGNVQIDDNQSGLSDKQKAKGTKVGMGIKGTKIMVVIAKNVNMQEFAYVFKNLGVTGALNLDTGGSTALFYSGRYVYGPGRDLPNAVIFAPK